MNVQSISLFLAQTLAGKLNYDEGQADVMRYGFEVIIGSLLKLTILLALAYLLNLVPHLLVILVTAGIYRLLSGGVHCTTYNRCLLFGILLYLSVATLAKAMPVMQRSHLLILLIILTVITAMISLKWAPAETENKPPASFETVRLKRLTLIWIGIWFVITLLAILAFPLENVGTLIFTAMLAHLIQALSLTPIGYRVVGTLDNVMGKMLKV